MKILVCGGREFDNWGQLVYTLDYEFGEHDSDSLVIQGGAKGADFLGRVYAKNRGISQVEYPADWKTHKWAAGPIRNQQMLDEGKPDKVVAFEGGKGTADMVARARDQGFNVVEVT